MGLEAELDPYDVVMDLLDAGRRKEVVWRASDPFLSFADHAELDETKAEYDEVFQDVVDELTGALGQPRVFVTPDRGTPPSWANGATHVAVWAGDDELSAYAVVHHARMEDPFELRIGVR